MTQEILIRLTPNSKPQPITPKAHFTGKYGYVVLGQVQIGSRAGALAALLRSLADELEPPTNAENHKSQLTQPFPKELDAAETGWPWLVKFRPWIFKGIRLSSEPYAHYLEDDKTSQLEQDLKAIAHLQSPSLADIAETLTGERQYGGAKYKRVKAAQQALKSSTTTAKINDYGLKSRKQAA